MAFNRPREVEVQFLDRQPKRYEIGGEKGITSKPTTPPVPGSEGFSTGPSHFPSYASSLFDVGIFKDTLLPSLALHGTLSTLAYGLGRYTDRVEAKDFVLPLGQLANAWWSSVGRRVFVLGLPLSQALTSLSWPERLLLTGVSLWGTRLLARTTQRSIARGKDDPRYESEKSEDGFWDKALFTSFLPEALVQTLVALPYTAPFRHQGAVLTGYHPYVQMLAVGLFSTGFAIETVADYQLEAHKKENKTSLLREGVWSIVRHPNYLGEILQFAAFPILLYGSDMLAPVELLSIVSVYGFLRFVRGDAQTEASQLERYSESDPEKKVQLEEYKQHKQAVWPGVDALQNTWTWIVVGVGALGVVVEQGWRSFH